jgi:hypothetical protein
MKIRCGFVSNSSSSSTIILVPKGGLKMPKITDEMRGIMKNNEDDEAEVIKKLEKAIKSLNSGGVVCNEEIGYGVSEILNKVVEKYEIASLDVSSEAGCIIPANKKKVEEILKQ